MQAGINYSAMTSNCENVRKLRALSALKKQIAPRDLLRGITRWKHHGNGHSYHHRGTSTP